MITYKTARKIDSEKLYELYKSVGWTKNVKNKKQHSELLANVYSHSRGVVSAWDKAELVGVVRFISDDFAHSVIYGLAVSPKYQGEGIASTLVESCIKVFPNTSWSVEAETTEAAKLFKSLGFEASKTKSFETPNCPV